MPRRKELTEEEKTAALVTYLFAVLLWEPGYRSSRDDEPDDADSWFVFCTNIRHRLLQADPFGSCVWSALRYEADSAFASGDEFLGYLAHVCRNNGWLAR